MSLYGIQTTQYMCVVSKEWFVYTKCVLYFSICGVIGFLQYQIFCKITKSPKVLMRLSSAMDTCMAPAGIDDMLQ